jgi:hypothetical protein
MLARDSTDIANTFPLLTAFDRYVANVTGSGPFGDFVLPTLLIPDNVIKQCAKPGAINALTGCGA